MKFKVITIILLFIAPTIFYGQNLYPSDPFEVKLKKIKEDIYVASPLFPLRLPLIGNSVIIINDVDVIVVDSGLPPLWAERVIAEIRKLTDKPVRYLINTHSHGDHTFGNQVYAKAFPNIEIISNNETREALTGYDVEFIANFPKTKETRIKNAEATIATLKAEAKPGNEKIIAHLEQYWHHDIDLLSEDYKRLIATPPTLIVSDGFRLYRGNRIIDIKHLGFGDTEGDLVIHLPKERLVCIGDMATQPVPFGFSEHPLEWQKTLGKLLELDFDTIIPGHGGVQTGKTYIQSMINLLQSVQDQTKAGIADGLDAEGVRKKVDLSKFEKEFVGDDPIYRYYFKIWFADPNIRQTFKVLTPQPNQK